MSLLIQLLVILVAYLLGCFAVGYYLVLWRTGQDLREVGSGATGGRNAGRALGKSGAIITGVGDILKGVIAMAIALWFNLEAWAIAFVMVAVLVGHIWPFQLEFRGGKGLSAAFGAVLMYDFRIALFTAVMALLLLFLSRKKLAFIMLGLASSPVIAFLLEQHWEIIAGISALVLIIFYAHRENIRTGKH